MTSPAMEYGGGGGGVGGSGGGDHHDASDPNRNKKRYHRHTAHQIQLLESTFKECPHPDEKTRMQLSRDLGLAPRQIKFWFQNRRTQMKVKHEQANNSALREDNDKIRCENIAIREALKNAICPTCGGPPVPEDSYFDEQKLRFENSQLKEELDRVSSIVAKYIGRPLSQLSPMQPMHLSSLDLSMASYGGGATQRMLMMTNSGPSLDLDLLTGTGAGIGAASSSTLRPEPPYHSCLHFTDMDRSLMADIAATAMDQLIRLVQTNEPLWTKSAADGRDVLDLDNYERVFPRHNVTLKNPHVWIEASRASGDVMMNGMQLVEVFVDTAKWVETFPSIVSRARTMEVIPSGLLGCGQNGSLQLMYEEVQVLSPLVPTRQFNFLRFCQQIDQDTWAVVDVSYDPPQNDVFAHSRFATRRLPSGCLIYGMPNGYSKVTWVEHLEIEEKTSIHRRYRDLIYSGLAFGAERWLACLRRSCERLACVMMTNSSARDLGGVIPSAEGKRSVMKLAQRMVNNFCASINPAEGHQWSSVLGFEDLEIQATLHKSTDPRHPNGAVLGAAATIWLPVPPQNVFDFIRDESNRPQWDVLANQSPVQQVAHIANGSHPGNCISVLRAYNTGQNNILILQESCTDASGSLVVYCPVDLPAVNVAMSGEDTSHILLLPSGFAITADGSTGSTGSLVTVVFQMPVSSLPAAKMGPESMATVSSLMGKTVHEIKAALNCSSATT